MLRIKPALVFFCSLVAILTFLVVGINAIDLTPTDLQEADLKMTLLPFRVGFYILVVAAWMHISRFLCRPRIHAEDLTPEMIDKWETLTAALVKSRWKVALFFVCFELMAIQQLGM